MCIFRSFFTKDNSIHTAPVDISAGKNIQKDVDNRGGINTVGDGNTVNVYNQTPNSDKNKEEGDDSDPPQLDQTAKIYSV